MATKRNLRSRNKRRVTKKRLVHRRTKKHISKRSRYSRRVYQRGGKFNEEQTEQIREALTNRNFRDGKLDASVINNILNDIQNASTVLCKPHRLKHLLQEIETGFNTKDDFMRWMYNAINSFSCRADTDSEGED